jgi:hypothetical protein
MLYLVSGGISPQMTQLEVLYRYVNPPTQIEMLALDNVREVYGIRKISFNEKEKTVRVEFDASRMKEPVVAGLLRRAGMELKERLVLA